MEDEKNVVLSVIINGKTIKKCRYKKMQAAKEQSTKIMHKGWRYWHDIYWQTTYKPFRSICITIKKKDPQKHWE